VKRFAYLIPSVVVLGFTIHTPGSQANSDCDRVTGDAHGQASGPATFVTTVDVVVGEQPLIATSTTTILEQTQSGGGAIQATSSHVFEVNDGTTDGDGQCEAGENCFTTLDRATLSPTDRPGLFRLNSHLEIVTGNGTYADACGQLVAHGFINFGVPIPTVEWDVTGRICHCAA
jgi:hypothetical protein